MNDGIWQVIPRMPFWHNRVCTAALIVVICTATNCGADQASTLRLVGSAEGREFTHIESRTGELVEVSEGSTTAVPRGTRWRLEGNLIGHESEMYFAPPFSIVTRPNHPIHAEQRTRTFAIVRLLGNWPWVNRGDYFRAVVVVLWLVDDRVTHVVPVATNTQHGPSARVKALAAFELAHDESRGRPVAMLLREGRWLAADRWFSHAQVDAVFAQLHLQVETDVKAALKNVNPRELLTRRQAEPLLYMVATCGFDRAIPDVMEVGSSQMRTSDDSTALHIAAGGGYREVVRALLATGAKPRPLDDRRISPIDLGLWAGHIDLVCDLLGDKPHPEDLRRALQLALDLGNTAALRRLLAVGGERVVKGLHPEDFGRTLEVADPEIVQRLIQLGMPLNDERALLHAAASGNAAVVQTLLDAGARADRTAPDRTSAVHIAAARGSVAVIEALYRAGADLNAANKFGESPLGVAARAGHTASVTFLTRHGATVNSVAEHEPRRDPKTRWITDCLRPEAERVFSEDDVDLPPRVTMIARIAVSRELSVNWNSTQTTQYGTNPFTGEVTTYNQTQAVPTYSSEGHGSTWAVASMIVEADGSVSHVFTVAANSEETRLAVDKAVDQYRFEPGEREGRKVRTRVTLPILVN